MNKFTKRALIFLHMIVQPQIDSYLIAMHTISQLNILNAIVDKDRLLRHLSVMIQDLHRRGIMKHMSSCLTEVLSNAFGRYSQLGLCDVREFELEGMSKVCYI